MAEAVDGLAPDAPADPGAPSIERALLGALAVVGAAGPAAPAEEGLEQAPLVEGARRGRDPGGPRGDAPVDAEGRHLDEAVVVSGGRARSAGPGLGGDAPVDAEGRHLDEALDQTGPRLGAPRSLAEVSGLDEALSAVGGRLRVEAPAPEPPADEPELAVAKAPKREAPTEPSPVEAYGHPARAAEPRGAGPVADAALGGLGSPSASADDRVPLLAGLQVADGAGAGAQAFAVDAAERLALSPDPAAAAGPSPIEGYGAPTRAAAERVPMQPDPSDKDGGSPVEPYGAPTRAAADRVPMQPDASAPGGGSPVESYGAPARASAERVSMHPDQSEAGGGSPVESYGAPARAAAERVPMQPEPSEGGGGSPVESYGAPARAAAERVSMQPEAAVAAGGGPSPIEAFGQPSKNSGQRVALVDGEAPSGEASPLESYGAPARAAAERLSAAGPVDAEGASPLQRYGEPSRVASQRVVLGEEPAGDPAGPSVVERYGSPARDAAERLRSGPAEEELPGPSPIELYGQPALRGERVSFGPPDDSHLISGVERLGGSPAIDAEQRVEVTAGYIDEPGRSSSLDRYGQGSTQRQDRLEIVPDEEPTPQDTLGWMGQPAVRASERVSFAEPEAAAVAASAEAAGHPTPRAEQRLSLWGEAPGDPAPSTGEGVARTSSDRGDRLDLTGRVEGELAPSSLEAAARASRDRADRLGAPGAEEEAVIAAGAIPLSRRREDRLGRPDPQDLPPSTLGGVDSRALLEAGRLTAQDQRGGLGEVPNGLDGLMPHAGLRAADRMRMPDPEDELVVDEAMIGRVAVEPEITEVYGDLGPDPRCAACGEPLRRSGERARRRLDFRYQRYELLVVRRAVYHCGFCAELPPVVSERPRFLAGATPVGNGLLAQLIVARYGDHAALSELSNSISRYGLLIEADRLEACTRTAAGSVAAVVGAIRAEVNEAKRVHIDARGVPTRRRSPVRDLSGELLCVSAEDQLYWMIKELPQAHDKGAPDLTEGITGRKLREGEVGWALLRERLGWSRDGRWAALRHRLTLALVTDPQRAAYGLFLVHAIDESASPVGERADLLTRERALKLWLDEQAAGIQKPVTALERAVTYALSVWALMRHLDDQGKPIEEPEPRRFPKAWTPQWDLSGADEREALTTWTTLIGCCRRLGLRPWEYLSDLLEAIANERMLDPAAWTPRVWARRARGG